MPKKLCILGPGYQVISLSQRDKAFGMFGRLVNLLRMLYAHYRINWGMEYHKRPFEFVNTFSHVVFFEILDELPADIKGPATNRDLCYVAFIKCSSG